MAVYDLTIAGISQRVSRGSLRLLRRANVRPTLEAVIQSIGSPLYIPVEGAAVQLLENATPAFGGRIQHPSTTGLAGQPDDNVETRIDCVDNNVFGDELFLHDTFPGGTVKDFAQWVIDTYLGPLKGTTLDAGQPFGPTIPALQFTYRANKTVNDGMDDVCKMAVGWIHNISASNVLLIAPPGATLAPFDISDGDARAIGDVQLDITARQYANRIIVNGKATQILYGKDDFTSQTNGVKVTFDLMRTPTGDFFETNGIPNAGVVWIQADAGYMVAETFGLGSATWIYDPVANTITDQGDAGPITVTAYRQFPLPTGRPMWIIYTGTPDAFVISESIPAQGGPKGIVERVINVDLQDDVALQAYADAELAAALATPDTVVYETDELGLEPGQLQNIVESTRGINGNFVIQQIESRDIGGVDQTDETPVLRHTVTAVAASGSPSSATLPGVVGDLYTLWAADRTAGAPAVDTGTGIGSPAPPNFSVQYNNAGSFGGSRLALLDPDRIGETYSSISPGDQATLAVGVASGEAIVQAWFNEIAGKHLASWVEVDDLGRFRLNCSGPDMEITNWGGEVVITAETDVVVNVGTKLGNFIQLDALTAINAYLPAVRRINNNHTLDSDAGSGGTFHTGIWHDSASNHTLTLPDLSLDPETHIGGLYCRWLFVKNGGAGGTLTISPTSATIEGNASMVLQPNDAVIIFGKPNSSPLTGAADWKTLGGFGSGSGTGTAAAAGSDGDVQYNTGGLLDASATFNFQAGPGSPGSGGRLMLTTDHTEYNQGDVLRIYASSDVAPSADLVLIDLEPGFDATVTAAVGSTPQGLFIDPAFTTAASGTHPIVAGTVFSPSNLSDGGATTTEAATVYISGAPSFGVSRHALFIDAGGSGYVDGDWAVNGNINFLNNSTGGGSASLNANCPAVTPTAPYTWLRAKSADGSTVYIPAWK